jgi:hypothetical protein
VSLTFAERECEVRGMFIVLIVSIISQCMHVRKHLLFANYILIKLKKVLRLSISKSLCNWVKVHVSFLHFCVCTCACACVLVFAYRLEALFTNIIMWQTFTQSQEEHINWMHPSRLHSILRCSLETVRRKITALGNVLI